MGRIAIIDRRSGSGKKDRIGIDKESGNEWMIMKRIVIGDPDS